MTDLSKISATAILKLIDTGTITSRKVVEHFIEKIELVNPSLNAVVLKLFDEARKEADKADDLFNQGKRMGRLHGLPFTIKECLDLVGTPSTFGLLRRRQDFPLSTDIYVKALQEEGAIVLGKTNVSQLLLIIESQNPVYGTTNNPHSKKHTAGGSSGGEGAIISAGGSPIGLGTDIGGSVRIPAAFNGICSIKPTTERAIDQARFLERPLDLPIKSVTGILANHAEDLQLFLDIINTASVEKTQPLKDFKEVDCSKLKVGYILSDHLFEPSNSIKRGVLESVEKLKSLGIETTLFEPPNMAEAEEIFTKILSADKLPLFTENLKNDKPSGLLRSYFLLLNSPAFVKKIIYHLSGLLGQSTIRRTIRFFEGKGEENLKALTEKMDSFKNKYLSAMDNSPIGKLDAIISPIFPLPTILHNTADRIGPGGAYSIQNNVMGFPAGIATISKVKEAEDIPRKSFDIVMRTAAKNEKASAGLPLSIQIFARHWEDHIVIALINQLHQRVFS